jgi:hypothetical protein
MALRKVLYYTARQLKSCSRARGALAVATVALGGFQDGKGQGKSLIYVM